MKCQIQHESCGRLRVHLACTHMTLHEADVLEYYIKNTNGVEAVQPCGMESSPSPSWTPRPSPFR